MKILFLTNKVPYPPKDGGSIATMGMIDAFASLGHQTTVLAMNTKKHHVTPYEIPETVTSKVTLHMVEVPAPVEVGSALKNLFFSRLPYNAERFISTSFRSKLKSLLESQNFDVVQLEGLYLWPYTDTIRKYSKALVVYRSHNIEHEIWERTVAQSKGIKKWYIRLLTSRLKAFEQAAINQYDLLVPITARDEKQLNAMGNTKPALPIPAGFNFEEVYEPADDFDLNLFFIGALDWSPNQEGLLWFIDYCWPKVLARKPKTILKIAGRNAPQWFSERISQKNIAFLGEIDDARAYIRDNGIMIAPLLSGSGMRVKIIEGMMYQKAIVTTSIGCEGIDVRNEEELFIADDPEVFASYLLKLLSNREQVIACGEKAFKYVRQHYHNVPLTQKLAAFYTQHSQ
ncbi:glycosyltransferase family 4 protein [Roseimarinus sediminis]|uniref:glycosyltransferase family 4 protein n=1 Tax=Roseimarinus sediminis TaxID=1610899 RepID=UPI003D1D8FF6